MQAAVQYTIADAILSQLHPLIREIGYAGGQISASEYDTAQVLRFAPPKSEKDLVNALSWLMDRQHADGGFGDTYAPRFREMITLAVAVTFHHYETTYPELTPVREAAVEFIRNNAESWVSLPEDMPIGAELIIPRLLDEAERAGMELPTELYAPLRELGARRRSMIAKMKPGAGTTAAHSWEAWGVDPDPALIDGAGGVGHSPAATAAWLSAARGRPELEPYCRRAEAYLRGASEATATGIPGVVPPVWPNERFEQIFELFALDCAGLLKHPELRDVVKPQIEELADTIAPYGVSFSHYFTPDGDDTATAMVLLAQFDYDVPADLLAPFNRTHHFATWPTELQISLSTTAHAVHALALLGETPQSVVDGLIARQNPDGSWSGDKWHSSPFYITSQSILALNEAGAEEAVSAGVNWLLEQQHEDGGWGICETTAIETAYAVLALRPFATTPAVSQAIRRAVDVLVRTVDAPMFDTKAARWIGKTIYRPFAIDRVFELCAAWVAMEVENRDGAYLVLAA